LGINGNDEKRMTAKMGNKMVWMVVVLIPELFVGMDCV